MLFSTSLFELTRQERAVMALFGRVHVNRFLKGNYFSRLNVINLNSPLVKSLPIINMEQAVIPISEGIPSRWHSSVPPLHTTKGTTCHGAPGGPSTEFCLGELCPHSLLEPPDTNHTPRALLRTSILPMDSH